MTIREMNAVTNGVSDNFSRSIVSCFEHQAQLHPDRLAVKSSSRSLNYEELNQAVNRVAYTILSRSRPSSDLVYVLTESGCSFVIAILGVLKTGKSYVPMDPTYPAARLDAVLNDSHGTLLLTENAQLEFARKVAGTRCEIINISHLEGHGIAKKLPVIVADDLAGVIYTSGTTGKPKGVMHSHQYILNLVRMRAQSYGIRHHDRLAALFSIATNASIGSIFAALLNGASIHFPKDIRQSSFEMASWIQHERLTILTMVVSLFRQFVSQLDDETQLSGVRILSLSGETVTRQDLEACRRYFDDDHVLVNSLAATETGTFLRYHIIKSTPIVGEILPVGFAIPGTEVLILGDDHQPLQDGEVGEIAVRSRYLASGYWGDAELTKAKFIPDPRGGDLRVYLTGDLGRVLENGAFLHLGRKDSQVKIRGVRVEPEEVAAVLSTCPEVQMCTVLAGRNNRDEIALTAFVVPQPDTSLTTSTLRTYLRARVPNALVPVQYVLLEQLPLTPNGKIDRAKLLITDCQISSEEETYVAPRTARESELSKIWETVFRKHPIGITDNFYNLGGESLLAIRLSVEIERVLQKKISVPMIFHAQTIEQLANIISEGKEDEPSSHMAPIQSGGSNPPIFCVLFGSNFRRYLNDYPDQPLYMLYNQGHDGRIALHTTVEDIAAYYLKEIRTVQPKGPYFLAGYSFGGLLVHEMAQQLHQEGESIGLLALVDPRPSRSKQAQSSLAAQPPHVSINSTPVGTERSAHINTFSHVIFTKALEAVLWRLNRLRNTTWINIKKMLCNIFFKLGYPLPTALRRFYSFMVVTGASSQYIPQNYPGQIVIFQTDHSVETYWSKLCTEVVQVYNLPCKHLDIYKDGPLTPTLLHQLMNHLEKTQ